MYAPSLRDHCLMLFIVQYLKSILSCIQLVKLGGYVQSLLLQSSVLNMSSLRCPLDMRGELESLLPPILLGPTSRISDSVGLGSGPRIYTSNKFPGDTLLLVGNRTLRPTGLLKFFFLPNLWPRLSL